MSAAEIADNKWELQASKAPVTGLAAYTQMLMMLGFTVLFAWILSWVVAGAFGPKQEGSSLEKQFEKKSAN